MLYNTWYLQSTLQTTKGCQVSTATETVTSTKVSTARPPKYVVIFHNDNKTTMEFVVAVLVQIFGKSMTEAEALTMAVHHKGKAAVAVYTKEIADEKVAETMAAASRYGYPLQVTSEPQED